MTRDGSLRCLAARQHGIFSAAQARTLGVDRQMLARRVARGDLRRVRRGVYAVVGAPETWEQSVLARVLGASDGAVASHLCAARLWGMLPDADIRPQISLPASVCGQRARRLGHRMPVGEVDRTMRLGIPVTSAARTIVDLTGYQSLGQLARILDGATVVRHLTTVAEVASCLVRLEAGPWRRTSVLQTLIDERKEGDVRMESNLERRFFAALVERNLPRPVAQHPVVVGTREYRLDFAYVAERIAVEIDGYSVHASRTAFDHDRHRANELVAAGWTVLRFTSNSTRGHIAATVEAALASTKFG